MSLQNNGNDMISEIDDGAHIDKISPMFSIPNFYKSKRFNAYVVLIDTIILYFIIEDQLFTELRFLIITIIFID